MINLFMACSLLIIVFLKCIDKSVIYGPVFVKLLIFQVHRKLLPGLFTDS